MLKVLSIDPGESSGWMYAELDTTTNTEINVQGGTITHDRSEIWRLLHSLAPDILLFEEFKLYSTHAKTLLHNTFYTCEIIGLLKLYAEMRTPETMSLVNYPASNKKYSGSSKPDELWQTLLQQDHLRTGQGNRVTGHTYDAYQHYAYWKRHNLPLLDLSKDPSN